MSRASSVGLAVLVAALVCWGGVPSAEATVMTEVSIEDMAADADAIVHGTVEHSGTRMALTSRGQEPHTITRIRVREWLKGPADEPTVTVREIGGEWKGGGMEIAGTPQYERGEEVVLFLERHPEHPGTYRTYAMIQGKFVVVHGTPGVPSTVHRDLEAVGFARWTETGMRVEHGDGGPSMQLGELLRLVREEVGYNGGGIVGGAGEVAR